MAYTNEIDLIVKYADEKAGGTGGQLVLDDVELTSSRDNRDRVGIGNEEPQYIEKGNLSHSFSTTAMLNDAAARALQRIERGFAETEDIYVRDDDVLVGRAAGLTFNELSVSASDDGDTTVQIDADLVSVTFDATDLENL